MPDLIILDIMLLAIDGISLCTELREKSYIPIIIVSAKDSDADNVVGISMGSDDYLVKLFSPIELIVRVQALIRRINMIQNKNIKSDNFLEHDTALSLLLSK